MKRLPTEPIDPLAEGKNLLPVGIPEAPEEPASWNSPPGATGRREPVLYADGEDEEGRSIGMQLVEQGIELAEDDQAHEGSKRTSET